MLVAETFPFNSRKFHAEEIAAGGAIASAHSHTKLYGILASGGSPLLQVDTLKLGRTELSAGIDRMPNMPFRFGVGFHLQTNSRSSVRRSMASAMRHRRLDAGVWPNEQIGFSYP